MLTLRLVTRVLGLPLMAAKDSGFLGCDVGLYSQKGNLFHTLVIHLPGLQRTDVGINDAGDGFMNFPD
jgi:hypothetical protein